MVVPILLKIGWNGAGRSEVNVMVHRRLLLVRITYWVSVSSTSAAVMSVNSLFIPASPPMETSLRTRTCA
jgi:hypothetical protein